MYIFILWQRMLLFGHSAYLCPDVGGYFCDLTFAGEEPMAQCRRPQWSIAQLLWFNRSKVHFEKMLVSSALFIIFHSP